MSVGHDSRICIKVGQRPGYRIDIFETELAAPLREKPRNGFKQDLASLVRHVKGKQRQRLKNPSGKISFIKLDF
jgi:hypothetical protein